MCITAVKEAMENDLGPVDQDTGLEQATLGHYENPKLEQLRAFTHVSTWSSTSKPASAGAWPKKGNAADALAGVDCMVKRAFEVRGEVVKLPMTETHDGNTFAEWRGCFNLLHAPTDITFVREMARFGSTSAKTFVVTVSWINNVKKALDSAQTFSFSNAIDRLIEIQQALHGDQVRPT